MGGGFVFGNHMKTFIELASFFFSLMSVRNIKSASGSKVNVIGKKQINWTVLGRKMIDKILN